MRPKGSFHLTAMTLDPPKPHEHLPSSTERCSPRWNSFRIASHEEGAATHCFSFDHLSRDINTQEKHSKHYFWQCHACTVRIEHCWIPTGLWDPRALRETASTHCCIEKASRNEPASASLFFVLCFERFHSKVESVRESLSLCVWDCDSSKWWCLKEHAVFKCKYNQCVVTFQGYRNWDSVSMPHVKHWLQKWLLSL